MKPNLPSPRVRITLERDVATYAELWHGAKVIHEKAVADPRGSHYAFMSALILLAFSVEAYCNAVGSSVFSDRWQSCDDPIERKSPLEKIALIASELDVSIDRSARPWQSLKILFRVRNWLAHGKVHAVRVEKMIPYSPDRSDYLGDAYAKAPWDEFCNDAFITRAIEDVEALLRGLHENVPAPKDALFSFGAGSGSAVFER
jgi:hypothetical protein